MTNPTSAQAQQNAWAQKMCPCLTQASFMAKEITRDRSRLVAVGGQVPQVEPEAVACQGPSCQWFLVRADEKGTIVGGDCAMTCAPLAANQQAMATLELVKLAQVVISKLAHVGSAVEDTKS